MAQHQNLAFGVSQMSQAISKRPSWVVTAGLEMLEYVAGTTDYCLVYGPCKELDWGEDGDERAFRRSMSLLEIYADASFSPGGGRSCTGVLAFYGGGLIQWESVKQSFAVLSTAECELMGYLEAMTLGDSASAVLDCLEGGIWMRGTASKVIFGDSMSGVALLSNPEGPWRTRHLRLREFALRERIHDKTWHIRHVKGEGLAADLLTKAITSKPSWEKFKSFVGLKAVEVEQKTSEP